jgi:hypothetical protein
MAERKLTTLDSASDLKDLLAAACGEGSTMRRSFPRFRSPRKAAASQRVNGVRCSLLADL